MGDCLVAEGDRKRADAIFRLQAGEAFFVARTEDFGLICFGAIAAFPVEVGGRRCVPGERPLSSFRISDEYC